MLEWMHDSELVQDMRADFANKTIDDCLTFILSSKKDNSNYHFAISNDKDEYMGTVSLKHVNFKERSAELGIVVRRCVMGLGFSWYGLSQALLYAFDVLSLDSVFWCVEKRNIRANKFYTKHGFTQINIVPFEAAKSYLSSGSLNWYVVSKEEYLSRQKNKWSSDYRIVPIKTVGSSSYGQLSFFETMRDIPFEIKRIYYITNVQDGTVRGFHAHKHLKQFLFCPFGEITIIIDNGRAKKEILLDNPHTGLLIEKPLWRELVWNKSSSVLCVAASDYYTENDYIRNYEEYIDFLKENHML